MSLQLSPENFVRLSEAVRPILVSIAYKQVGHPLADELAQDAITEAFEDREGYDAAGEIDFARWLRGNLRRVLSRHFREQGAKRRHEVCLECLDTQTVDPEYEAAWRAQMERTARVRKLEEIGLRLRFANLTRIQKAALLTLSHAWPLKQAAEYLHCSVPNVHYHRKEAIRKLNAVNLNASLLAATDIDRRMYAAELWLTGSKTSIYHKPQSTGAGLAIRDLKNGWCSVTRKESIL